MVLSQIRLSQAIFIEAAADVVKANTYSNRAAMAKECLSLASDFQASMDECDTMPSGRGSGHMKERKEVILKLAKLKGISHCGYTREDLDMEDPAVAKVIDQAALNARIECLKWVLGVL